jgi:hypothetical protein
LQLEEFRSQKRKTMTRRKKSPKMWTHQSEKSRGTKIVSPIYGHTARFTLA